MQYFSLSLAPSISRHNSTRSTSQQSALPRRQTMPSPFIHAEHLPPELRQLCRSPNLLRRHPHALLHAPVIIPQPLRLIRLDCKHNQSVREDQSSAGMYTLRLNLLRFTRCASLTAGSSGVGVTKIPIVARGVSIVFKPLPCGRKLSKISTSPAFPATTLTSSSSPAVSSTDCKIRDMSGC